MHAQRKNKQYNRYYRNSWTWQWGRYHVLQNVFLVHSDFLCLSISAWIWWKWHNFGNKLYFAFSFPVARDQGTQRKF